MSDAIKYWKCMENAESFTAATRVLLTLVIINLYDCSDKKMYIKYPNLIKLNFDSLGHFGSESALEYFNKSQKSWE